MPTSSDEVVWDSPVSGGSVWTISIVDGQGDEWDGRQGVNDPNTNTIQINSNTTTKSEALSVRFHEEFHTASFKSGWRVVVQTWLNLTDDQVEKLEEITNCTTGQYMFDYLTRNGYLTYPDIPKLDAREDSVRP